MSSRLVRWSVLMCAGWWLFGGAMSCPAQQTETARKLYERAKAAADTGDPERQLELGKIYEMGIFGIPRNGGEAVKWYRKAADQGNADAQLALGRCHANAIGVTKDFVMAADWYRRAALQGNRQAQFELGHYYRKGYGVSVDLAEAYKWFRLAAINGQPGARHEANRLDEKLTRQQVAYAEKQVLEFNKSVGTHVPQTTPAPAQTKTRLRASGIGFFISEDGYFVTSSKVVKEGGTIRLHTSRGEANAKLVCADAVSGLIILKAEGNFPALPIIPSGTVRLGSTPLVLGLQPGQLETISPQSAKVEVVRLAGAQDDARYFELSAPPTLDVSAGALLDEHGNVIGLLNWEPNQKASLLPSNLGPGKVAYALKSSYLLSFLESMPEVAARLKPLATATPKSSEDTAKDASLAAAKVLVY